MDEWNNIPVPVCKAISDIINELIIAIQLLNKNESELARQNMVVTNMKSSLSQEIIRKYDQTVKDSREKISAAKGEITTDMAS